MIMPPKLGNSAAQGRVPDPSGFVGGRSDDQPPVEAKGGRIDLSVMPREHGDFDIVSSAI